MIVAVDIQCPTCHETISVAVDTSEGTFETIEDCTVCCRPMTIRATCEPGEVLSIDVSEG